MDRGHANPRAASTRERFARVLLLLAGLLIVVVAGSALVGSQRIDLGRAMFGGGDGNVDAVILFRIRLPRALLAMIVGGALAAAGTVLQVLLRNPLAEPHLLGVSGGAAFGGVVALIAVGVERLLPAVLVPVGAFAGALATMVVVYRLGTVHGRLQPYTFLLAGVVCNAFIETLMAGGPLTEPAIALRDVTFGYGAEAVVRDISFATGSVTRSR